MLDFTFVLPAARFEMESVDSFVVIESMRISVLPHQSIFQWM